MTDIIKTMEDKHIKESKESFPGLTSGTEIIMRFSFSAGASMFRTIGQYEGDRSRIRKIVNALGIVGEEVEDE